MESIGKFFSELGAKIRGFFAPLISKMTGKPVAEVAGGSVVTSTVSTTYEINLVPEVKHQMIRAQRMRNMVLFICIVVSAVAIGAVLILFGIKSGQDIALGNVDKRLETMSGTLNSYSELEDLVKIQDQLGRISDIVDRKTVLSRVFGAMGAMLPQGDDEVTLSELRVNLETNLITIEGQADAREEPLIDYRVLESFKKGVALTMFDYGSYVDATGEALPTQCVREADDEGNAYKKGDNYYAWWDLTIPGCEGVKLGTLTDTGAKFYYSADAEVEEGPEPYTGPLNQVCDDNGECHDEPAPERVCDDEGNCSEVAVELKDIPLRVKIWRTPQFTPWLNAGKMSMDGEITGVEHFESACYKYSGTSVAGSVKWTSVNDCMLVPNGFEVKSSANGRDESENLVLKFTGSMVLADEFFQFANKNMIAIGPMGQNVTDSYVQISGMFAEAARECEADDAECLTNMTNKGGN